MRRSPYHSFSYRQKLFAVAYGICAHVTFLFAVFCMFRGLFSGMQSAGGTLRGPLAWASNIALVLQFPVLHSYLLSGHGRKLLSKVLPLKLGSDLSTTSFALISSLQLLALFTLWSPTSGILWRPGDGIDGLLWRAAYGASWLLLLKALYDAGLSIQLGYLGWGSVVRDKKPQYPGFHPRGMFVTMRHPVYLAFALVLWSGPIWTVDHLLVASVLSTYCVLGPLLKEHRYQKFFGESYKSYRESTPYFAIPLIQSSGRNQRTK